MPFSEGRPMSSRIRSGCNVEAFSTASKPSDTSQTICRSGGFSNLERTKLRNHKKSSTNSIRYDNNSLPTSRLEGRIPRKRSLRVSIRTSIRVTLFWEQTRISSQNMAFQWAFTFENEVIHSLPIASGTKDRFCCRLRLGEEPNLSLSSSRRDTKGSFLAVPRSNFLSQTAPSRIRFSCCRTCIRSTS